MVCQARDKDAQLILFGFWILVWIIVTSNKCYYG